MKHLLFFLILSVSLTASAQDYSSEKTTLVNFLKRMYNQTKFEGVKIVDDYDNKWFVSVLTLEKSKYKNNRDMFRVAEVKSMRQVSEYINGGNIAAETIVHTKETKDSVSVKTSETSVETMEKIRSAGFVQGMELLNNFTSADDGDVMIFVYGRHIPNEQDNSQKRPRAKSKLKNK
jgi:hypothetical protein